MAGMDTGTILLIGGAGYLAYALDQGLWPFEPAVLPTGAPNSTPVASSPLPAATGSAPISTPVSTAAPAPVGAVTTPVTLNSPTPPPVSAPSGSTPSAQTVSQKMVAAGGNGPFNMDQWCYYYNQVTGNPCPDPGAIPASVYAGAGIVDRTTPTDIGTWLAVIQNQDPSLGLSGYGFADTTTATDGYATSAQINSLLTAEGIQVAGYDLPWWIVAGLGAAVIYMVAGGKK